ncbi:PKD domain-containing protein [Vicingaceae bacterium]|nr:PKD domain-containing protein [Vicingaceae bacterium]
MKNLSKILVVLSLVLFTSSNLCAQIDTEFWFAAPWVTPDHDDRDPIFFHFSTFGNPTTVRIQQPASTYDTTFIVPANALFSKAVHFMMDSLESKPADQLLRTGFQITSDFPMIVVYDVVTRGPASNNPETYSLKGTNGIGIEFVLPFQTLWNNRTLTNDRDGDGVITQPYQQFNVVATEDNTTIYITPRCDIVGHPANVTFPVVLPNKGNVYTGQNITQLANIPGNNLSGTIVVADKPISVTVSDDSVNPSGGGGCYDLMGDQIVPTDVIGTEYIVNKGFLNAGSNESIFIVATENFTSFLIDDGNGVTNAIINQGETYQFSITDTLTYVNADKPVYVYHMSGVGCEMGEAIIPPTNCSGSDQVSFSRATTRDFYLNLLCPAGAEGNFTLNGSTTLIDPTLFDPVPGTGGVWMGAQIQFNQTDIPVGTPNLLTNSTDLFSLGVFNGSATGGVLYHYLSSFNRKVIIDAGAPVTLCNGSSVNLPGTITGGATTGIWSVLNGTGTLNTPTNLITTYDPSPSDYNQGSLTFVLESTGNCDPVRDTVVISFAFAPEVTVSTDSSLCRNNAAIINLSGTLQFAAGSEWTGGNGGAFGNSSDLVTTYTPSNADLSQDSLVFSLASLGSLNSCPNDTDIVIVYFSPSPVVNPGSNQVICSSDDSLMLNGSVSGHTTTGFWSTTGSGLFNPSALSMTPSYAITSADTTAGTLLFTLTSTNNGSCLAVKDSIEVTILDKPTVTITSSDSICSNATTINLSGTVSTGFTTMWNVFGSGNVINPSSLNTIYNISPVDITNGFVDVILSTDILVCSSESDSIRIYFVSPPTVYAGLDTNFCANEVIQLNGTITGGSQSGSWLSQGTGMFSNSNLLTTFYIPSALDVTNGGVNLILTSSSAFGCIPDDDTLTVTFIEPPVANFSVVDACQNEPSSFTDLSTPASNINSWAWDFGGGSTSSNQNPIYTFNTNGTVSVELIVGATNGCFDTIRNDATLYPLPFPDFTPLAVCENNPSEFYDNSFIAAPNQLSSFTYVFNLTDSISGSQATYTYPLAGVFPVTYYVTSTFGCTADTTKMVTVLEGPDANFSMNPNPAQAYEDVVFTDLSQGDQISLWVWDFGNGSGDNLQNTLYSYSDGGTYQVVLTVTDIKGCFDSTAQELLIVLPPLLPTAFTPNGDGENDVFKIRGGPFTATIFSIYNNWGELIFQTDDATIGWDGSFEGNNSPLGVYTWTFEVEIIGGEIIKKSGDVTLMR